MVMTQRLEAAIEQALEQSLGKRPLIEEQLSGAIIGAAIEVHRHLGPGLLESIYEDALMIELEMRGIAARRQVPIAMTYKGRAIGEFFADLVVEDRVVVELKAIAATGAVHVAQVMSYLRATGHRLGLLINFNVPVLHQGMKRVVL
jgi:GxxExxY protein